MKAYKLEIPEEIEDQIWLFIRQWDCDDIIPYADLSSEDCDLVIIAAKLLKTTLVNEDYAANKTSQQ